MAIPRKQIGWSQESNLLWEISRQMEKLTGVAFNSGGGGGGVQSVTGLNTDNSDPLNPIVEISVDGNTVTGSGTPGNPLVAPERVINVQCIDLSVSDYTVSEPGVYNIIEPNGGYEIIILGNPQDYNGKTITFINQGGSSAPISSAEYIPLYQGTGTQVNQINSYSTLEIVAAYTTCDNAWRTKPSTAVVAREGIILTDGLSPIDLSVGIDGGGFYVINVANDGFLTGGQIFFPPANAYIGQRIVILNRDGTYDAVISNNGNAPIDLDNSTINIVPLSTGMEFISTGTQWRVLSSRTV